MAATRAPRKNAGANMASLIKDFHEEETFTTLYGGFNEEPDDAEFGLEQVSDDGSDVDFDEVEEDLEDDIEEGQDEDEGKRRRRKPAKLFSAIKRKSTLKSATPAKKAKVKPTPSPIVSEDEESDGDEDYDEQTPSTSSGDREDSRDGVFSPDSGISAKKKAVTATPSGRSIRDSTAAKRFETEELEMHRALRRQEIGPRKKVKHHVPTQKERLAKSQLTEKKNRADLEKHERDEEENEKKKSRKPKATRGPFESCFISTTQTPINSVDEGDAILFQRPLEMTHNFVADRSKRKYSRSVLCFKEDAFQQTFSEWKNRRELPEGHACIVTGRPAHYLDPVTRQYYCDAEALKTLRGVIYRHLLANPVNLGNQKVIQYVQWFEERYDVHRRGDHSQVGNYDYSMNVVRNEVNGDAEVKEEPLSAL